MPELALPDLLFLFGVLSALVACVMARGAITAWSHSFGLVLQYLAQHLDFRKHTFLGTIELNLGAPFAAADQFVLAGLQAWAEDAEAELAFCLHGLRLSWLYTVEAIEAAAHDAAHFGEVLVHHHLPRWQRVTVDLTLGSPHLAAIIARAVAANAARLERLARAGEHTVTVEVSRLPRSLDRRLGRDEARLARLAAAVAAAAGTLAPPWPHGLASPWPAIRGLAHSWARLNRRLRRVEGLFGATVMAAAIANVLGVAPRCLRSGGNIGRAARALCGMPTQLLEDLLGLVADFIVLENICTVLPWLEAAVSELAVPLVEGLTAAGAGLCNGPGDLAPQLATPALHLPPVQGLTLELV